MVQKIQNDQKLKSRGPALKKKGPIIVPVDAGIIQFLGVFETPQI